MLPYTLVRSRRKTLALTISREGELVVRAPLKASLTWIEAFIREKEPWVLEKQTEARLSRPPAITGQTGDLLPFAGETLTIAVSDVPRPQRRGALLLLPQGAGPAEIAGWLREQAGTVLPDLTARRAEQMGLSYTGVHLSEARGRWGSCSAKGVIRLSWRLVLCPPAVMDYVAVHELCHLRHMDHSGAFWAAVEQVCPDWRTHRQWLADHRGVIDLLR